MLQCSRAVTGYEQSPVTQGRWVAEYPLLHCPLAHFLSVCFFPLLFRMHNAIFPRVVVSSNFTVEPLQSTLHFWASYLGMDIHVQFAEFDSVFPELLKPASLFKDSSNVLNAVLVRLDDWIPAKDGYPEPQLKDFEASLWRTVWDFEAAVRGFCARPGSFAPLLIIACKPAPCIMSNEQCIHGLTAMSDYLETAFSELQGVSYVSWCCLDKWYPLESGYWSPDTFRMGHVPYTKEYYVAVATLITRRLFGCLHQNTFKVFVTDCDHTLWDGAVSELGPKGVRMTECHLLLQRKLLQLQRSGRLICLSSKNDEADVLAVFRNRPTDMCIGLEDVAARKVNWQPKSTNIKALAEMLNLGLDAFVFIDDNPLEIHEVQTALPQVTCVHLPIGGEHDPTGKARATLDHHWAFDVWGSRVLRTQNAAAAPTRESLSRTTLYQEQAQRDEVQRTSGLSFAEFLRSLEVQVDLHAASPDELPRVAELSQRSNQFNSTTIRRTEAQVRAWLSAEARAVACARVRDRFGDYGVVLVALWRRGLWPEGSGAQTTREAGAGGAATEHVDVAEAGAVDVDGRGHGAVAGAEGGRSEGQAADALRCEDVRVPAGPERVRALSAAPAAAPQKCTGTDLLCRAEAAGALYVDSLMMSCRVLHRGVEYEALRYLASVALQAHLRFVVIPFVRTAKNSKMLQFLRTVDAFVARTRRTAPELDADCTECVLAIPAELLLEISLEAVGDDVAQCSAEDAMAAPGPSAAHAPGPGGALGRIPAELCTVALVADAVHKATAEAADAHRGAGGGGRRSRALDSEADVTAMVRECAEQVLGTGLGEADLGRSLEAIGMASVQAVHFFAALQTACDESAPLRLPSSLVFEHPTISAIGLFIHESLQRCRTEASLAQTTASEASALRSVLTRASELVEDVLSGKHAKPLKTGASLPCDVALSHLGVDEMLAEPLHEALCTEFGVNLPDGWAFEFLTLNAIAESVLRQASTELRTPVGPVSGLPPCVSTPEPRVFGQEQQLPVNGVSGKEQQHKGGSKEERSARYQDGLRLETAADPQSGLYQAKMGHVQQLRELLARGWDPRRAVDKNRLNALAWAAGHGHVDVVALLLEHCVDIESPNKEGRTALMWACRNGHLQAVQLLVERGANLHAQTKKGINCFHWAVWGASIDVADWLLQQGMDLEGQNNSGCTAPIWAAASGSIPMCKWLLHKGSDFTRMNFWGHGVVNKAAWHGHRDALEWLLALPGVETQMFLTDAAGRTPVELAGLPGHTEVVHYLKQRMDLCPQPLQPAPSIDISKLKNLKGNPPKHQP